MTILSHPSSIDHPRDVAREQVAYWRSCGLRIADMWDAIEYRHHGGERELLVVLAERWVDCRRWLQRETMARAA
jgi:hypothetical protein